MYIYTKDKKYINGNKYYSYSNNEYTLLEAGVDYQIGDTIPANSVYSLYENDKMYIQAYNGDGYYEFPYQVGDTNTLPPHDVSANDVDEGSYTNTAGKTIRNRVRHDVASLDFNVSEMSGAELKKVFEYSTTEWCKCLFFYEPEWNLVEKKMYRSGTVTYTRYYIDKTDMLKSQYTDIQFSFVEE